MKPVTSRQEALQLLESTLLKQMLSASGAFKGSDEAGGKLHADLFVETLADAVAKSGGLGIARMIGDTLPEEPGAANKAAAVKPAHAAETSPDAVSTHALLNNVDAAAPRHPLGTVTSGFGPRSDPFDGTTHYHTGVDLAASVGTPVLAATDGVVDRAGPRGGYGNSVEIDRGDGVKTLYAHASELLVAPGEKVSAGQPIALVGATGRATGPHLHVEVRVENRPVDPQRALNAYGVRVEDSIAGRPRSPRIGDAP